MLASRLPGSMPGVSDCEQLGLFRAAYAQLIGVSTSRRRSSLEHLSPTLDRTYEDGLRHAVRNTASSQVDVERLDAGNEDASDRSELLDPASQSEHLGLEILLTHR